MVNLDHGVNHDMNDVQHRLLMTCHMVVMEREEDQENSTWFSQKEIIPPQTSM